MPAGGSLPARSRLALTAGFIIAASGAILTGPNLGTVLAGSDDHAAFWRAENARKAAASAARPTRPVKRLQAPRQMSAYAPAPQWQTQRALSNPVWFILQPRAINERPAHAPAPRAARKQAASRVGAEMGAYMSGRPRRATSRLVCVRLCDGYFFPAPLGLSASDAGCATACPNAPARLYSMRSDRIADAVSARDGAPYTKLPVAFNYTRNREQTCSCGAPDPKAAILADASLRRGDRFMTESGFLIYQGGRVDRTGRRAPIASKDFASLSQSRGISRRERSLLMAMERVSLPRPAERLAASLPAGNHVALGPPRAGPTVVLR